MTLLDKIKSIFFIDDDPFVLCDVYKNTEEKCAHIDGMFCDIKTCDILKNHNETRDQVPDII
jgi:hypothetical protein